MSNREDFEKWAVSHGYDTTRCVSRLGYSYRSSATHYAFEGYVAYQAPLVAAPTPPAQDEPVAYAARNYMSGKWGYIWHEKDDVQGWITLQHQSRDDVTFTGPIALYTHPSNDKLRQAAEEVVKISFEKDVIVNLQIFAQAMDKLRAALEGK